MKTIITSLVKIQNASYWVQKSANVILAGLIIWGVLTFVAWVAPALVQNIINDFKNAH